MENKKIDFEFLKLQYQVLSNKQIRHNSLVWNTPSLLFVAIAFLWNIALDATIHIAIRCLVSFVSVFIAFASLHHFVRNRLLEVADSVQLEAIERLMMSQKDVVRPAMIVHHKFSERTIINPSGKSSKNLEKSMKQNSFYNKHPISDWRTFDMWKLLLEVILLIAIILFVYNLFQAFLPEIKKIILCNSNRLP